MLADTYKTLQEQGKPLAIVFISSDRDEAAFNEYHDSMPWLAMPYGERELKAGLSNLFGVRGIPTLILLKRDGTLVTADGREAASYGADCFPWDEAACERGKAAWSGSVPKAL